MDLAILTKYWAWYSLIAAIGIIVGVFSYRTSFPPIGNYWRISLAILRGVTVFLIGLFIVEPVLNMYSWKTIQPKLAVLFDISKSMNLPAGRVTRLELADSLSGDFTGKSSFGYQVFGFSNGFNSLNAIPSAVDSAGDATSIANAVEELGSLKDIDNYGAALLVTDGRQNLGGDPLAAAMKLGLPIHTLTLGERIESLNLSIDDVNSPAVVYSGDTLKIEVQIRGEGTAAGRSRGYLNLDGKVIAEKSFGVPGEGRRTAVEFETIAPAPGSYRYGVSVPVMDGESESIDNDRVISINVLKNRLKVLLAADILDWEYKFIKQSLSEFDEFEIDAVYPLDSGRFSEPGPPKSYDDLRKYDATIFVNCRPEDVRITRPNLRNYIDGGGALVYMAGSDCLADLKSYDNMLPIELSDPGIDYGEFLYEPSVVRKQHAAILLDTDPEAGARIWRSLPPFSAVLTGIKPLGETLLETRIRSAGGEAIPVLTVGELGRGRVAAITGYPLWKSYFGARKGNDSAIPVFWKNLVRWATAGSDSRNFEVAADRDVYRLGEPVKMSGYLYDEANRPRDGALVTVAIAPDGNPTAVKDAVLTQFGNGIYKGEATSLAPGDYKFKATALAYGDTLGTTTGKFTIEKFSLELTSGAPDYSLTRRISEATGGKAYTADNFGQFDSDLKLTPFEREKHTRIKPFGMPIFLIIVLCGLCIEWGVRKKLRLP